MVAAVATESARADPINRWFPPGLASNRRGARLFRAAPQPILRITISEEDGMGQVLGLGVTHFPPLSGPNENLGRILKRALEDPAVPEHLRQPEGWPAAMREEYGADAGL